MNISRVEKTLDKANEVAKEMSENDRYAWFGVMKLVYPANQFGILRSVAVAPPDDVVSLFQAGKKIK